MQEEKKRHYQVLMDKMKAAYAAECYFESAWLAYAILEDRLMSALRLTGGTTFGNHRPIQTLGPKIGELSNRREHNKAFAACFSAELMAQLEEWKDQRDKVVQAMADYSAPIEAVQEGVYFLAQRGMALASLVCAANHRFKKYRATEALH